MLFYKVVLYHFSTLYVKYLQKIVNILLISSIRVTIARWTIHFLRHPAHLLSGPLRSAYVKQPFAEMSLCVQTIVHEISYPWMNKGLLVV